MKRFAKGFTLAETMIVIVVLGIIATLTIPALVNKNKESVAKTKLRKAMAAYESALNKMIIENDLKDNGPLTTWAGNLDNGCANSTQYFKKVQGDGCIFKTSDGVWWNISDIERPLIAFKQDDLTTEKANAQNDYSAFVLVGRFGNDGSLRVDDLAYETSHDEDNSKAQVEKLYSLLGMKKSGGGGNASPFAACNHADTCVVNGIEYTKITIEEDYSEDYENYCDPSDWIDYDTDTCGENDDKWQNIKSEAKAGEYYITIESSPFVYNAQAHADDHDNVSIWRDYYKAAKNYCKNSGGRLPTRAELKSLQSLGKLPAESWIWASEAAAYRGDEDSEYYYDETNYGAIQLLCIGK